MNLQALTSTTFLPIIKPLPDLIAAVFLPTDQANCTLKLRLKKGEVIFNVSYKDNLYCVEVKTNTVNDCLFSCLSPTLKEVLENFISGVVK